MSPHPSANEPIARHSGPLLNPFAREGPSFWKDALILLAGFSGFYAILSLTRYWTAPVQPHFQIQLAVRALPYYALLSLERILLAYVISLAIAIIYGYAAAHNRGAENVLIPLLDILQSIPVLSFLPAVMIAMVALFPTRQLGIELGCILLIVTGQVWNLAFSFYSSVKSIPREMLEAAAVCRLGRMQKLLQVELPYAAIGLIWNSMMSVAGGWFFLMACEMFVLGDRDLRLPGLGSYLQTAANAGDFRAIAWGITAMVTVIVLVDLLIWRPLIAWSERFKFEQVEASQTQRSWVYDVLRRSRVLSWLSRRVASPLADAMYGRSAGVLVPPGESSAERRWRRWTFHVFFIAALAGISYGTWKALLLLSGLTRSDWGQMALGAGATFLRVEGALVLGALWTIPAGIYIGLRPRLSAAAQPLAQIAASVPATALFPVILLALIRLGGGLGIGSIVLLLMGTQWYILFNVIAGASAIPTDLREVCELYRLNRIERWRKMLLPGIFPYLITGFVTASGGAWNASIVAEYFRFHGRTYTTTGLGSIISSATDRGDFPAVLGATIVMAGIVVTMNRLLWRRLYRLASTKYKLEV
jgi:NitT/TauT family transport system permease protein